MKKRLLPLLIAALLFATFAYTQKQYTLRFNPPDGGYDISFDMASSISQSVMEQAMKTNMTVYGSADYDIATDGQNKKLHLSYKKMGATFDGMGQKMEMDSDNADTTNNATKVFKSLIGKKITFTLSPLGKVLQVDGLKEIMEEMKKDVDQNLTTASFGISEDFFKSNIEQTFNFYPEKPIKIGDSWTANFNLKSPIPLNFTAIYTLDKVEGNIGYLSVNANFDSNINNIGNQPKTSNPTPNIAINGLMKGSVQVNLETGMPLTMKMDQDLSGDTEVKGQKISIKIASKTTFICTQK